MSLSVKNLFQSIFIMGALTLATAGHVKDIQTTEFGGIGITLQQKDGQLIVRSVLENSPAEASGILKGDIILNVDEMEMEGLSLTESVNHMRGVAGDPMDMVIARGEAQTLDFSIPRVDMTIKQGIYTPDQTENMNISVAQSALQVSASSDIFLNGEPLKEESKVTGNSHLYAVEYGSLAEQAIQKFTPDALGVIRVPEEGTYRANLIDVNGKVLAVKVYESNNKQIQVDQKWVRHDAFVTQQKIR